jgi:hypothetical protein
MSCRSGASRSLSAAAPAKDEAFGGGEDDDDELPRGFTLRRDGDGSLNDEYPLVAVGVVTLLLEAAKDRTWPQNNRP